MSHRRFGQPRFGDVSIYDYANAKVAGRKGRLSKACGLPDIGQEVRDLEQRLDDGEDLGEAAPDPAGAAGAAPGTSGTGAAEKEPDEYLELPEDIWFAIGDHIPPEDVHRFASICKISRKVTNSARFWFGLYRRYYSKSDLKTLPDRLKPDAMVNLHGLRACVIRTMFFIYPPFVEQLRLRPGQADLRPLLRRKCIATWYTNVQNVQNGKYWTFWFKLKRIDPRLGRTNSRSHPATFRIWNDISANDEKDCKVLQVSCPHYLPLPAVQGHVLTRAQSTVSHDMMANKLCLHFSSDLYIVLDPASSVQVLDWWHPQYPHPSYAYAVANNSVSVYNQIKNLQNGGQDNDWYSYV